MALEKSSLNKMSDLGPLTLHFRPFLQSPRVLEGFTVSKDRGEADGKRCLIIRRLAPSRATVTEALWVDPEQHYCVRRYTKEYEGKVWYQLDVQYRRDSAGPVPTGWQEAMYYAGDGTLTKSVQATVFSSEVNITLPDSEFELAFPPGTRVLDSTGVELKNGPRQGAKAAAPDVHKAASARLRMFDIGADGTAHAVTDAELVDVPSLEGDTPRSASSRIGGHRRVAIGLCASLAVALSVIAVHSMLRRR